MEPRRYRVQAVVRAAALGFVLVWLFVPTLQELVPFWVPFAVLAAAEVEFAVRGWREGRDGAPPPQEPAAARRAPGADDADLGWGRIVEDDGGLRYEPPPRRTPRRRRRALVAVGVAVVGAALFVVALQVEESSSWRSLPSETRTRVEQRLSREASAVAERRVTVRCDDGYAYTGVGSDALGVAFIRRGLAYLHPDVCRTLHDVLEGERRERDATGEAVLVLAHEAVHLAGERDEAVTECKGLQEGVAVGRRLGLSRAVAQRLMASRYRDALSSRDLSRLAYRPPASCRNGGALDLRPADPTFP